jgi:tetratricopeptide (TPR) repeat protein
MHRRSILPARSELQINKTRYMALGLLNTVDSRDAFSLFRGTYLTFCIVLTVTAALAWWLSGYDTGLTGDDRTADFVRRSIRCGLTVLMVAAGGAGLLQGGVVGGWLYLVVTLLLGISWAGCLSELFAGGFHRLVDAEDKREFDPKQTTRDLDRLAGLVRSNRNDEAIALCEQLKESGEASALAIETVLFQLYHRMFDTEHSLDSPPLAEAQKLRWQRRFAEAEAKLESLLKQEPENVAAALMLLRIYAQDLLRPDKADAMLQTFGQRPHVPPAFIEYARRCLAEWSGIVPAKAKTAEGIESLLVDPKHSRAPEKAIDWNTASVDELLAAGHLATAIKMLESQVDGQPRNFELWLKLAEAHGVHCGDFSRASKIIQKIEANSAFRPEQIALAKANLQAWQARGRA